MNSEEVVRSFAVRCAEAIQQGRLTSCAYLENRAAIVRASSAASAVERAVHIDQVVGKSGVGLTLKAVNDVFASRCIDLENRAATDYLRLVGAVRSAAFPRDAVKRSIQREKRCGLRAICSALKTVERTLFT